MVQCTSSNQRFHIGIAEAGKISGIWASLQIDSVPSNGDEVVVN
jgi:hypothetical protein